jgi:hypothetical protein
MKEAAVSLVAQINSKNKRREAKITKSDMKTKFKKQMNILRKV